MNESTAASTDCHRRVVDEVTQISAHQSTRTIASSLFVLHRVPTFAAVIRKLTHSLYDYVHVTARTLWHTHGPRACC